MNVTNIITDHIYPILGIVIAIAGIFAGITISKKQQSTLHKKQKNEVIYNSFVISMVLAKLLMLLEEKNRSIHKDILLKKFIDLEMKPQGEKIVSEMEEKYLKNFKPEPLVILKNISQYRKETYETVLIQIRAALGQDVIAPFHLAFHLVVVLLAAEIEEVAGDDDDIIASMLKTLSKEAGSIYHLQKIQKYAIQLNLDKSILGKIVKYIETKQNQKPIYQDMLELGGKIEDFFEKKLK